MELSQGKQSKSGKRGAERRIRMEERRKDGVCGTRACWLLLFSLLPLFAHYLPFLSFLFPSRTRRGRACALGPTNSLSKAGGGDSWWYRLLSSPLYDSRMGRGRRGSVKVRTPRTLDSAPAAWQLTPSARRRGWGAAGVLSGGRGPRCEISHPPPVIASMGRPDSPPPVFIPLTRTSLRVSVCLKEGMWHVLHSRTCRTTWVSLSLFSGKVREWHLRAASEACLLLSHLLCRILLC